MPGPEEHPQFVEYGGTQSLPAPVEFKDVTLWCFFLRGSYTMLRALSDRFFKDPSGGEIQFVPLTPYVMLSFANIAEGRFVVAPERGYASERELTIWIFGARQRRVNGGYETGGLCAFSPYLFLDNPVARITGREEFGYLKQAGWLILPMDEDPDVAFAVDVYGCSVFGHDQRWQRLRFLTIEHSKIPFTIASTVMWGSVEETIRGVIALLDHGDRDRPDDLGVDLSDYADLLAGNLPQMFLKQYRDIEDGTRCCYQAITEAEIEVTHFHGTGLSWSYPLEFTILESTPVVSELGLEAATDTGLGLKLEIDMRLKPGRVLWQP